MPIESAQRSEVRNDEFAGPNRYRRRRNRKESFGGPDTAIISQPTAARGISAAAEPAFDHVERVTIIGCQIPVNSLNNLKSERNSFFCYSVNRNSRDPIGGAIKLFLVYIHNYNGYRSQPLEAIEGAFGLFA